MKEITHDLNHDLTFYCTHNQLCVPQYKVNVYSTWGYITLPVYLKVVNRTRDGDFRTMSQDFFMDKSKEFFRNNTPFLMPSTHCIGHELK